MEEEKRHQHGPGHGHGTGGGHGKGDGSGGGRKRRGPGAGMGRGAAASRKGIQDVFLYPRAQAGELLLERLLVCVDDTDDLSGSTSTGYVSELVTQVVEQLGGEVVLGVTRHQLLLSEQVKYTSHNSSMCFEARMPAHSFDPFWGRAVQAILGEAVPTSDPGLCIARMPDDLDRSDVQAQISALCDFGHRAQTRVCAKEEAYMLADTIPWLRLSEHGGDGLGVIGALAGVGLRLDGSDGRFRGKWNLPIAYEKGCPQQPTLPRVAPEWRGEGENRAAFVAIGDFIERVSGLVGGCVEAVDVEGADLPCDMPLELVTEAKPIYRDGAIAFVCNVVDGNAVPFEKVDLGSLGIGGSSAGSCEHYKRDTDDEECAPFELGAQADDPAAPTCRTCLYRRFTERGFTCLFS